MFIRCKSTHSKFITLKTFRKSENADCLLKWEKDTMLSQVNASQNSWQMIDNIHNDFQLFAFIMNERFDNTPKDQSNYYLREEIKKECREETAQNKADKLLNSLQMTIKVEDKQKRLSWIETYIHEAIL